MKHKWLLKSGFLIPVVFWLTTIICGFILPGYSHASRMVSELGEAGTKTQYLFAAGLVLTSVFSIFFNIGLFRICRNVGLNIIPILILWTFSFSILGAGIFPFPQRLHGILGSPSIILFLSPLSAFFLWKSEFLTNFKVLSLTVLIFMLLGFLVFFPNVMSDFFGIKQRFFHLGWSVWFLYLAVVFNKIRGAIKKTEPCSSLKD